MNVNMSEATINIIMKSISITTMNKPLFVLMPFIFVGLWSCQTDEKEIADPTVDVYAAGYADSNATYWKNGIAFMLAQNEGYTYATSIYVVADDVYVTGRTLELPLYWKNAEKIFLQIPSDAMRGETHDIIVKANDVHIAGDYFTADRAQPAYWKNGLATDLQLPAPFTNGHADKMTLDGSDVYISGYVRTWNTTMLTAALWKNGTFIPLSLPVNYALSNTAGVAISEGHVYVSGYIASSPYPSANSSMRAVYWKDGKMQFVEQTKRSSAAALAVAGSDVYIPYNVSNADSDLQVNYLKNHQQVAVDQGAVAIGYDLAVSNDDVYLAGTYKQNSASSATACYWINGQRVLLPCEKESQAVSCFIVRIN